MSLPAERRLKFGLFAIRVTVAAMFLVWVADKVFSPETSARVFSTFYFSAPSGQVIFALGLAQLVIVLLFLAGALKTFSYGAVLAMHVVSTLSSYERLLEPLARPNILFWAAVPVLGALLALFLMRAEDTFLALPQRRR